MADLDAAALSAALKEYYDESVLTDLIKLSSPIMRMIKRGKFLGKGQPYPMVTDPGQASLSGTFTTANSGRVGATYKRFFMGDVRKIYAVGGIDRDVIDLSSSPRGAFEHAKNETNTKLSFVAREHAHTLYRGENALCGEIKTIAEGGGKTTIVVEDPADIRNLGPGAPLVASATKAGALRAATTYAVETISHTTGTLVLTGTAATTSLWAVGDFLHRDGSAPAGSDPIYHSGFADWIPDDEPTTGDSHYSVDRSVNPDHLAGLRIDATTSQIREAASEMGARIMANGGSAGVLAVHPLRHHLLEMELDVNATHEKVPDSSKKALVGYNGLRIATGAGSAMVVADPFCPFYRGYMLSIETWCYHELGGKRQPRLVDMGGGMLLRQENADAMKFQTECKGDLGCANPGANGVIKFAA